MALSSYFLMSLPDWIGDQASRNNWDIAISDRDEALSAVSDPFRRQE
jgi:hypothetical protein